MIDPQHSPVQVMTVLGPVPVAELGRTLTHEHLLNDIRGAVTPGARPSTSDLLNAPVSALNRHRLLAEPYSSYDNCTLDSTVDALAELQRFASLGGKSVVDVTPSSIGRNPQALRALAQSSGLNLVMGSGWYLSRFEQPLGTIDELALALSAEFEVGVEAQIRPGVIGEIGVSADFTGAEQRSLRAACIVQRQQGVPLFIHLPGWLRLGEEILSIVLDEMQVSPGAVVLCHMDPSGEDAAYQQAIAERGVWLEFDMVGMPFTYPGEGISPTPAQTAAALSRLVHAGHHERILLSHDLFLKAMLSRLGGEGLGFVAGAFREQLNARHIDADSLLDVNPAQLFITAAQPTKATNS